MLSICHINIRSLPKHFTEFLHHHDLFSNDIICFSETWLNESHPSSIFQIPGYEFIRKDRGMASRGGGLAIFVKSSIKFEKITIPVCGEAEMLAIDIKAGGSGFRLLLVYNPPYVSRGVSGQFEQLFDSKFLNKNSIILGDFNID
jgi:exonuclease III